MTHPEKNDIRCMRFYELAPYRFLLLNWENKTVISLCFIAMQFFMDAIALKSISKITNNPKFKRRNLTG